MKLEREAINRYFEQFVFTSFKSTLIVDEIDNQNYAIVSGSKRREFTSRLDLLLKLSSEPHKGEPSYYREWDQLSEEDPVAYVVGRLNSLNEWSHQSYDKFKRLQPQEGELRETSERKVDAVLQQLFSSLRLAPVKSQSAFFTSHDIDSVYGSFLQNGLAWLKQKNLVAFSRHVFREVFRHPGWLNMDQIQSLNTEYGLKTTFFWLVTKKAGEEGVKNADYNLRKLKTALDRVSERGGINALHKSSANRSFEEELSLAGGVLQPFNRYHFLKFRLPEAYYELEKGGIQLDSSLGFAHHYGFRNGFGLPFRPFNFNEGKAFNFVEAPLHFMDGTFQKYMGIPTGETATTIMEFYENHNYDCVFALLWHNTFFAGPKYGGYLEEYVKLLTWIKEEGIPVINPKEIVERYRGNYD